MNTTFCACCKCLLMLWVVSIFTVVISSNTYAQTTIDLYSNDSVPNFNPGYVGPVEKVVTVQRRGKDTTYLKQIKYRPTITMYAPPKHVQGFKKGSSIIVCPGGSYSDVLTQSEGKDVADFFTQYGITVFVLRYRVPNDAVLMNKEIVPLQDAQQAIAYVRSHAKELNILPNKIGIMGFSAGGHLAAMASTYFNKPYINHSKQLSLRPDFSVLVYPIISFRDSLVHRYSKKQLFDNKFSYDQSLAFSAEMHVTPQTPPAFLVHALDDQQVKITHSLLYQAACNQNSVPAELFIYEYGKHGYGLYNTTASRQWTAACVDWLKRNKWIQ